MDRDSPAVNMGDVDDIAGADARPSILATLAGGATICIGLTGFVTAIQLWTIFYLDGWRFLLWLFLLGATVVQMGCGGWSLSGSDVATILTTALTWLLQLLALAVCIYVVRLGLFAPLILIWTAGNALCSLVLPLAVPAALRTSANRRRLYAS